MLGSGSGNRTEPRIIHRVVLDLDEKTGSSPTSEVILELDQPSSEAAIKVELARAFDGAQEITTSSGTLHMVLPDPSIETSTKSEQSDSAAARTPGYHAIYCNSSYAFVDADGRFSVQRQCGSRLVPWGYRFSSALQSICVNYTVDESGMRWWKDLYRQPNNAPHPNYGCGYQFHGTLNPVPVGSLVKYEDDFTFRHNVGGGGNASLHITGKLEFLGPI